MVVVGVVLGEGGVLDESVVLGGGVVQEDRATRDLDKED